MRKNHNKMFMIVNAVLFIAVMAVAFSFVWWSYTWNKGNEEKYSEKFNITLRGYQGDDIIVYLNDSMLLDRVMPDSAITLTVKKFAPKNAVLIVDKATELIDIREIEVEQGDVEIKKAPAE